MFYLTVKSWSFRCYLSFTTQPDICGCGGGRLNIISAFFSVFLLSSFLCLSVCLSLSLFLCLFHYEQFLSYCFYLSLCLTHTHTVPFSLSLTHTVPFSLSLSLSLSLFYLFPHCYYFSIDVYIIQMLLFLSTSLLHCLFSLPLSVFLTVSYVVISFSLNLQTVVKGVRKQ